MRVASLYPLPHWSSVSLGSSGRGWKTVLTSTRKAAVEKVWGGDRGREGKWEELWPLTDAGYRDQDALEQPGGVGTATCSPQ